MAVVQVKTLLLYVVITIFFGFLSYQLVLWFRQSISWRSYVVQSGSMEPSIMTGDMIIIRKQQEYQKNDVITFKDNSERTVTHRIMERTTGEPIRFTTKGDANQTADTQPVSQDKVIGKVIQVIPKFGYVVQFIKSPWGFILCIITPAILIIYDEARAVFSDVTPSKARRRRID